MNLSEAFDCILKGESVRRKKWQDFLPGMTFLYFSLVDKVVCQMHPLGYRFWTPLLEDIYADDWEVCNSLVYYNGIPIEKNKEILAEIIARESNS